MGKREWSDGYLRRGSLWRIALLLLAVGILMALCPRPIHANPQSAPSNATAKVTPDQGSKKSEVPQAQQEEQALESAFRSAEGNPQVIIRHLEDFLAHFPNSPQRDQVQRTIYKQALQANDLATAATYAEKLLDLKPDDSGLLSTLVDLLERQADSAGWQRALHYADHFVDYAEQETHKLRPSDIPEAKWRESQSLLLASAHVIRGKIYAKSNDTDKAIADFEKSYAAYPTAQTAERLGELAARKNDFAGAVDHYATAFAFPQSNFEAKHREEIRRKLGSAYLALHHSEQGLGDLVMTRYDELQRMLSSRFREDNPNSGLHDPFDFVLERPDGSALPLRDYRGRVLVMEFWATWCGPCRLEGKLLESVERKFHNEPGAAFLAINVDDNRDGVAQFLKEEKWTVPVAYARGLDRMLDVQAIPTLMIFGRDGRMVYRQQGLDFQSFVETLEKKVQESLAEPATASTHSR
jgi:thiol-disulfide isomerase/thioredoxin